MGKTPPKLKDSTFHRDECDHVTSKGKQSRDWSIQIEINVALPTNRSFQNSLEWTRNSCFKSRLNFIKYIKVPAWNVWSPTSTWNNCFVFTLENSSLIEIGKHSTQDKDWIFDRHDWDHVTSKKNSHVTALSIQVELVSCCFMTVQYRGNRHDNDL